MDDLNILKARLNEALALRDMTPQQLADISGLHFTTIYRYLNGSRKPNSYSVEIMAAALRVSPTWLYGFDELMKKPDFVFENNGVKVAVKDINNKEAIDAAIIELLKISKGVNNANTDT